MHLMLGLGLAELSLVKVLQRLFDSSGSWWSSSAINSKIRTVQWLRCWSQLPDERQLQHSSDVCQPRLSSMLQTRALL